MLGLSSNIITEQVMISIGFFRFNPSIQLIAVDQVNDVNEASVEGNVVAKIFNTRDWIFYIMIVILLFVCGALIGSIWMLWRYHALNNLQIEQLNDPEAARDKEPGAARNEEPGAERNEEPGAA